MKKKPVKKSAKRTKKKQATTVVAVEVKPITIMSSLVEIAKISHELSQLNDRLKKASGGIIGVIGA